MDSFSVGSNDIWEEEVEPQISALRHEKWLDPVLADKFEAMLNNYNGSVSSGDTTNILGKLESISTMLSMDSYYRVRNISEKEKRILLKLNESLLLLKTVLSGDLRTSEAIAQKAAADNLKNPAKLDKLPNLADDKDKSNTLYGDGKNPRRWR